MCACGNWKQELLVCYKLNPAGQMKFLELIPKLRTIFHTLLLSGLLLSPVLFHER